MVFIDPNLSNLKPHNQATTSDFKSDINCVLGLKKLKPCFSGSESSIHNQVNFFFNKFKLLIY